jgi:septum formation protein
MMRVLERIVLASASPRRLELLRSLGFEVEAAPSGYPEPELPGLSPAELASAHALAKLARAPQPADRPVVAADTVVDIDGIALGKPRSGAEAAQMLHSLSGREHVVHSAFALAMPGLATPVAHISSTRVRFHPLADDEIREYVATGEPMDKAGAYGIQGYAATLVAAINGDFYTVMGFPLGGFVRTLRGLGFVPPAAKESHGV